MFCRKRNDLEDLYGRLLPSENRPRVVRETTKMVFTRDGYKYTMVLTREQIPRKRLSWAQFLKDLGLKEQIPGKRLSLEQYLEELGREDNSQTAKEKKKSKRRRSATSKVDEEHPQTIP